MNEFIIDFTYQQKPFSGLVYPAQKDEHMAYTVKLESENQELTLDIVANPCGDGKTEWCFSGISDEVEEFDKALLQEIGEAIEKYQANH